MVVLLIGLQVKVMACLGRFHDFSSGYSKFQLYGVSFSLVAEWMVVLGVHV